MAHIGIPSFLTTILFELIFFMHESPLSGQTDGEVVKMYDSKSVLDGLISNVQMGQTGIRSVLDRAVRTDLRRDLHDQLAEYDTVETKAHSIAQARGWELKEVNPAIKAMSNMIARAKLTVGRPDSKIAAMMIQGNTRGMILGLKDMHRCKNLDPEVESLSKKLLEIEQSNIAQMQGYL